MSEFEAGAASRQGEIDKLQRKLQFIEALRNNQFEHLLEVTEQRDASQKFAIELQKRIDELEKSLKNESEKVAKLVRRIDLSLLAIYDMKAGSFETGRAVMYLKGQLN